MSQVESLLPEALEYASYGFKVFALSPLSKIPLKNTKGFKEATTDQETIFKMFTENEQANIGISMVELNYFVLDIDTHGKNKREGIESFEKLLGDRIKELDNVVSVKTANGGLHLYFSYPDNYQVEQRIGFRPSIDIIKNFVVAPNSVITKKDGSTGKYELENGSLSDVTEAPKFLLDLITAKEQPKQSNAAHQINYSNAAGQTKKYTATLLEEITQGVKSSERNIWLTKYTGKLLYLGMDPAAAYQFLMVVNDNFIEPPLPDNEVNKVFKSVLKAENNKRKGVS